MRRRVLYIENDKALTDSFQECLRDRLHDLSHGPMEIELVVARHMEEANQLLDSNDRPFGALIVDLMLPRNGVDLSELERLERQRAETVRRYFRRPEYQLGAVDEEAVLLRKEIEMLDRQIEPHVAPEGGCEILEGLARKLDPSWKSGGDPKRLELPVIFFTARGLPEVRQRCVKLVSKRFYRFFEKPALEEDVLRTLLELLTAPTD
jgi:CheY-like chemotaxis protein